MVFIDTANKWLADRALGEYIDKGYRLHHTRNDDGSISISFKDEDRPFIEWPAGDVTQQQIYDACREHEAKLTIPAYSGALPIGWVDP